MAASLAPIKRELRNQIKYVLKGLPEAAAATQCMSCTVSLLLMLMLKSIKCYQDSLVNARVQGSTPDKCLSVYAGR